MKQANKENLAYIINGLSMIAFFFLSSMIDIPLQIPILNLAGWILLGLGVLLVLLSSWTLLRHRGKGLIDWGIYGLVRHPMYLGAMLLFISWSFLLPHWTTLALTTLNVAIVYRFILQADSRNVEVFGKEYEQYAKEVPRINIMAGFIRSLRVG
jgi:protein-S-isoprenylcysteine O-methyltransferase Ste14